MQSTLFEPVTFTAKPAAPTVSLAEIADYIEKQIAAGIEHELDRRQLTRTVIIKFQDGHAATLPTAHRLTPDILRIAAIKSKGKRDNILLVGPAGSGKTSTAKVIADALKLDCFIYAIGPQTVKSDILGFIDATGNYQPSTIRLAYENGGVLLLDEFDAGNAGSLTLLNNLLDGTFASFPDKTVIKHENFICICSANTYGRGADRQYCGRNQLDAATLDRFTVLNFDYDEELEMQIAPVSAWTKTVQKYRHRAEELKLRVAITPRASIKGGELLLAGFSQDEVEDYVLFKGISPEVIRQIKG